MINLRRRKMKIIEPYVYFYSAELSEDKLINIEKYGRLCYKSEDRIGLGTANAFIKSIIESGHESVIEHEKATVIFVVDRGISHEIVRHRIASYSQESTRYCNYSSNKFGKELVFIKPYFFENKENSYSSWAALCSLAEKTYINLTNQGISPQEARSVLPNSLKTEIAVTFNFREWRHFFKLRCSSKAHPQMRQVAIPLLLKFKRLMPAIFEDVPYDHDFHTDNYAKIKVITI